MQSLKLILQSNDAVVCVFVSVRSVGEIPACAEFDCSILEDGEQLNPGIELNDLTLETIQHK